MRISTILPLASTLLLCLALATGCEQKKKGATEPGTDASSTTSAPKGEPVIRDVQVSTSPASPPPKLVPKPEELRARVIKILDAGDYSRTGEQAPAGSTLAIEYGSREIAPPNETPKLMLSVSGVLQSVPHTARYERIHLLDLDEEKGVTEEQKRDVFLEKLDSLARAVQQDMEVDAIEDSALFAFLEKKDIEPEPTSTALRRLRGYVVQDPARHAKALAIAKKTITSEDPRVVVSSAGLAAAIGSDEIGIELVDAAARMSQLNQPQAYIALLAQMGEVGSLEVEQYLETVASGHPMPQIQQIAKDSLERARAKRLNKKNKAPKGK